MQEFVKALNLKLSEGKIKAGVFVGLQINKIFEIYEFSKLLTDVNFQKITKYKIRKILESWVVGGV